MPEYIEREAIIKSIVDEQAENHVGWGNAGYEIGYHNGLTMAKSIVLTAPAADVVAVVRCKDCIHRLRGGYCKTVTDARATKPVNDNFFCGYGERRGEDE